MTHLSITLENFEEVEREFYQHGGKTIKEYAVVFQVNNREHKITCFAPNSVCAAKLGRCKLIDRFEEYGYTEEQVKEALNKGQYTYLT